MDDLIRRDDAIEALAELARERFTIQDYFQIYLDALTDADIKIRQLPSAQRTGEWIQKPNIYGVAYCSECDYELHTNDTNYCPNCGADMRGDKNETD